MERGYVGEANRSTETRRDRSPSRGGVEAGVRRLHASLGNAAVSRMLAPKPRVLARFGEYEHRAIGDKALPGVTWKLPGGTLFPETDVSFGEWVALGDWFEDIEEIKKALRNVLERPDKGTTQLTDTVGQVYYAVMVMIRPKDDGERKRVENDYMGVLFNEADKAAVLGRYKDLKTRNIKHFPNPLVGDTSLSTAEKAKRRHGGKPFGAIAQYHADHIDAINLAISAGQLKKEALMGEALAVDGFACHFLTDAFSGSHMRTPRSSIETYWDQKVPKFDDKLVNWLADQVTLVIDTRPSGAKEMFGRELDWTMVREEARKIIRPQVPPLSFGDIVGLVVHDWEGEHGKNGHGPLVELGGRRFRLAGDDALLSSIAAFEGIDSDAQFNAVLAGKLRPKIHATDPKTRKKIVKEVDPNAAKTFAGATLAVRASVDDVKTAYDLARAGAKRSAIIAKLTGKDGLFASERLIPKVVPDAEQPEDERMPKWNYATVDELLADSKIVEALPKSAARVAEPFGATVDEIQASQAVKDHLRAVVLKPLTSGKVPTIVRWLKLIIAYSPADLEKRLSYHETLRKDLHDLRTTVR